MRTNAKLLLATDRERKGLASYKHENNENILQKIVCSKGKKKFKKSNTAEREFEKSYFNIQQYLA